MTDKSSSRLNQRTDLGVQWKEFLPEPPPPAALFGSSLDRVAVIAGIPSSEMIGVKRAVGELMRIDEPRISVEPPIRYLSAPRIVVHVSKHWTAEPVPLIDSTLRAVRMVSKIDPNLVSPISPTGLGLVRLLKLEETRGELDPVKSQRLIEATERVLFHRFGSRWQVTEFASTGFDDIVEPSDPEGPAPADDDIDFFAKTVMRFNRLYSRTIAVEPLNAKRMTPDAVLAAVRRCALKGEISEQRMDQISQNAGRMFAAAHGPNWRSKSLHLDTVLDAINAVELDRAELTRKALRGDARLAVGMFFAESPLRVPATGAGLIEMLRIAHKKGALNIDMKVKAARGTEALLQAAFGDRWKTVDLRKVDLPRLIERTEIKGRKGSAEHGQRYGFRLALRMFEMLQPGVLDVANARVETPTGSRLIRFVTDLEHQGELTASKAANMRSGLRWKLTNAFGEDGLDVDLSKVDTASWVFLPSSEINIKSYRIYTNDVLLVLQKFGEAFGPIIPGVERSVDGSATDQAVNRYTDPASTGSGIDLAIA